MGLRAGPFSQPQRGGAEPDSVAASFFPRPFIDLGDRGGAWWGGWDFTSRSVFHIASGYAER